MQDFLKEQKELKQLCESLLKQNEGKSFDEIMPSFFQRKKSRVASYVLEKIDKIVTISNKYPIAFNNQNISKERIAVYLTNIDRDELYKHSDSFIPIISAGKLVTYKYVELNKINPDVTFEEAEQAIQKEWGFDLCNVVRELNEQVHFLIQAWVIYCDYLKVRKGEIESWSEDGEFKYPRIGRGEICAFYVPIKGLTDQESGLINVYNPRTKKVDFIKIIHHIKKGGAIYIAETSKGKRIYICDFQITENCWDALFSINREIFGGWWNKILEKA